MTVIVLAGKVMRRMWEYSWTLSTINGRPMKSSRTTDRPGSISPLTLTSFTPSLAKWADFWPFLYFSASANILDNFLQSSLEKLISYLCDMLFLAQISTTRYIVNYSSIKLPRHSSPIKAIQSLLIVTSASNATRLKTFDKTQHTHRSQTLRRRYPFWVSCNICCDWIRKTLLAIWHGIPRRPWCIELRYWRVVRMLPSCWGRLVFK